MSYDFLHFWNSFKVSEGKQKCTYFSIFFKLFKNDIFPGIFLATDIFHGYIAPLPNFLLLIPQGRTRENRNCIIKSKIKACIHRLQLSSTYALIILNVGHQLASQFSTNILQTSGFVILCITTWDCVWANNYVLFNF